MTASRRFQIPAILALAGGVIASAWALTGTASRPQLTSSEAANQTVARHLAQAGTIGALTTDNWNPSAGVALLTADYAVAADGSTRYRSVQAAVDAAVAAGGTMRRYISVKPGIYREVVCVPAAAPPITLFGLGSAPANTTISFGNANPTPKPGGSATTCTSSPCAAASSIPRSVAASPAASPSKHSHTRFDRRESSFS
jgi:pectinesterase